jgi:hypothetical protein
MCNGIYVDPRVTFTRAGTRTYFGQEVVKAEENLLIRSQEFDNAAWVKTSATVTANAETAPDGTSTAETITATSANLVRVLQSVAILASTPYALSVSIKAGTSDFAWVTMRDGGGNNRYFGVVADLSTGTITQTYFGGSSVLTSSSIVSEGNGWYRVSIIGTLPAVSSLSNAIIGITDASTGNAVDLVGNVTASTTISTSISLWQAQLEQRSFVTAPTVTTTQPITRYQRQLKTAAANEWPREFDPVTGECLGRSVWESRTNLLLRSEEFDNAAWTKTETTITANQIIAPDGTLTADKLIATTSSGTHFVVNSATVTAASHTLSIYAKRGEYNWLFLRNHTISLQASFDLLNGVTGTIGAGLTASIQNIGNGWYRCSITFTGTAAAHAFRVYVASSDNTTFTGDGYSGIYIWGAQLEVGAFATPYIPTVAAQVTRLADSAVMTGVNFSSWYGGDRGTLFVDAETLAGSVGVNRYAVIEAGAGGRLSLGRGDAVQGNRAWLDSSNGISPYSAISASGFNGKLAGSFGNAGVTFAYNGAITGTPSTNPANAPRSADTLIIGGLLSGGQRLNGYIKRLTYYNQALTSANLQAVTR